MVKKYQMCSDLIEISLFHLKYLVHQTFSAFMGIFFIFLTITSYFIDSGNDMCHSHSSIQYVITFH